MSSIVSIKKSKFADKSKKRSEKRRNSQSEIYQIKNNPNERGRIGSYPSQIEASFLDRLHEIANMIAVTNPNGHRSFLSDPLPLIPSNKFSLQPDLACGWKPDAESLKKIPSLTQFKLPKDRLAEYLNVAHKENQEAQKKERKAELENLLSGVIAQINQNDSGYEEKEELKEEEEDSSSHQSGKNFAETNVKQSIEMKIVEQKVYTPPPPLVLVDNQDEEDDIADETPVNNKLTTKIIEPEPGPQTPKSNDCDVKVDQKTTKNQFFNKLQLQSLDDDIYVLLKNTQSVIKHAELKNTQSPNKDTNQIPLLDSIYDPWINSTYINNNEEYQCVYKRSKFKNSQDLLFHNLKVRPDPLMRGLRVTEVADKTLNPFEFNLGLPDTQAKPEDSQLLLGFDSEYESGNLETVLVSKKQNEIQKYVLLVASDYNSRGHCQWFNFCVSGLREDTQYEFELGPFKKKKSRFSQGMLPWVCDLSTKSGQSSKYPFKENIAANFISSVTYTNRRQDQDNPPMNFLAFKLFIKRTSTEYNDDRKFLIAYSEPYTYSRLNCLLNELQQSALVKKSKWLNFKVGKLCSSLGGTPLPLIRLTKKCNETVFSVYQKPVILVSARVHPGEPPGSFLCEGILRSILNPQNEKTVEKLLTVAEIHVVPMLNPDGVIIGNSRVNLAGVDMNRRWGVSVMEPNVTPEVYMLKEFMSRYKNQILMYLDLHGHTKGEGIFFYACQPPLPKPNKDTSFGMSAIEKVVLIKALPTIVGKTSPFFNLQQNRYFTLRKDTLSNKLNTARVVSLHELGINLSYTVESSFWSYSTDKKSKKIFDENAFMRAGADLLSGIFNVTFTTQKLQALNKTMLQFLTQKNTRLPGTVLVKKDAFLETLRPILKDIYTQVKKRFANAMQQQIIMQLQETLLTHNNTKEHGTNISNNDRTSQIERFQVTEGSHLGKVAISPLNVKENKNSSTPRAQIPILNKHSSEQSLKSIDEAPTPNPFFNSTLGDATSPSRIHATLQTQEASMQLSSNKFPQYHKDQNLATKTAEIIFPNQKTVQSQHSLAKMEPRLTSFRFETDQTPDDDNIAESSNASNCSGSESNPSVDNLEAYMMNELRTVIFQRKTKNEKKKKLSKHNSNRMQDFISNLRNFDKIKGSHTSLQDSIERALAGDARCKSQLAELQTTNHDMTLFSLNNQTTRNQFIPTNRLLQIGSKTKSIIGKAGRESVLNLENAGGAGINQKTFQMTERLSSIYNKSFIVQDSKFQLVDQQAQMEAILENRSRNFEASKNLTTPSLNMLMTGQTHMNATSRAPHQRHKKDEKRETFNVLPINQFKISQVFDKDEQLGILPVRREIQHLLPSIKTQLKFFNHMRAQSISTVQQKKVEEKEQFNFNLEFQLQPSIRDSTQDLVTQWKAVPTNMIGDTFSKKKKAKADSNVLQFPLQELLQSSQIRGQGLNRKPSFSINLAQKRHSSIEHVANPPLSRPLIQKKRSSVEQTQNVFNQLRMVPTIQRPNNRGAFLGSNLVPLQIIQKFAQEATLKLNENLKKSLQEQAQSKLKYQDFSSHTSSLKKKVRRKVVNGNEASVEKPKIYKPVNKVMTNTSFQSFGNYHKNDKCDEFLQQDNNQQRNQIQNQREQHPAHSQKEKQQNQLAQQNHDNVQKKDHILQHLSETNKDYEEAKNDGSSKEHSPSMKLAQKKKAKRVFVLQGSPTIKVSRASILNNTLNEFPETPTPTLFRPTF